MRVSLETLNRLLRTGCALWQKDRGVSGLDQKGLNSSQGLPKRTDRECRMRHATGNSSIHLFNRSIFVMGLLSMGVFANEAQYRAVGDAYEALMLRHLYQTMQDANGINQQDPDNMFAPSNGERIFRAMQDELVVQGLAQRRPLGVSDMVVRQLQGKGGVRTNTRVE
jgi:hypothetical protein